MKKIKITLKEILSLKVIKTDNCFDSKGIIGINKYFILLIEEIYPVISTSSKYINFCKFDNFNDFINNLEKIFEFLMERKEKDILDEQEEYYSLYII